MTTMPVSPVLPSRRSAAVPVLPPACVDADAAFRDLLDAAAQADGWDAPTRQGVLAWLARHRDVLAAVEGRVLSAEREAGTCAGTGTWRGSSGGRPAPDVGPGSPPSPRPAPWPRCPPWPTPWSKAR